MVLKLNQPELDFKNAQLFGMEPNHYEINKSKKPKTKENLNLEWRYKDNTVYMLRSINRLTRRELRAVKDLIENPDDFERLRLKHPIIEEDERRYD